jgi:hypothetical protein
MHATAMPQLSEEWSYFSPRQDIYCDCLVSGVGGRVDAPGNPERRIAPRRCSWFLLCVGRRRIVRIRIVAEDQAAPKGQQDGHTIRCHCGTRYEFEEIRILKPRMRSA